MDSAQTTPNCSNSTLANRLAQIMILTAETQGGLFYERNESVMHATDLFSGIKSSPNLAGAESSPAQSED